MLSQLSVKARNNCKQSGSPGLKRDELPRACQHWVYPKGVQEVAMYLLLTLCKEYHINAADKWYDHVIETPLPSYGTCPPIQTRTISANCPDVVAENNRDNTSTLIDQPHGLTETLVSKCLKSCQSIETLNVSLKKTEIVRVVPGSLGVIKKRLEENICKIPGNINLHEVQNTTLLETAKNHVENTQSIK